ncbi:MAG: metallophosphoesterase [Chitinophagales bacterium]
MSRLIPLLIATAILLLIDVYAFQAIRTVTHQSSATWKRSVTIVYWMITALSIGFIWYIAFFDFYSLPKWIRVYMLSALFVFYIPKIILNVFLLTDDTIRLGRWIASLFSQSKSVGANSKGISRSQFLSQAGLLVSGFLLFQFIYGIVRTGTNYQVRNVKLPIKNLPDAFNGYKIVQVSDIHSGSFTSSHPLSEAVKLVNDQNADVIFFTGDLVNNISDEALDYIDVLKEMKSKNGVFSIFGNHDYGDYYSWPSKEAKEENLKQLEDIETQLGWTLLRNKNILLGDEGNQLAIIGVDNWSTLAHFPRYGDLKKAVEGTENAKAKLLLSHDPTHWNGQVTKEFKDIAATFSGHTHGFQFGFEIPGLRWSPAKYVYPQWAGLYQNNGQSLYVNRGIGFLGYNGRVGISPEITVFELSKA